MKKVGICTLHDAAPNFGATLQAFALQEVLKKLQMIDCCNGPEAGQHNFFRGGDLKVYEDQTLKALKILENRLPVKQLKNIWDTCTSKKYTEKKCLGSW